MATETTKRMTLTERYQRLSEEFDAYKVDYERVAEGFSEAVKMLSAEDVGWAAPGESEAYLGLKLEDIQKWSKDIRTSLTGTRDRAPNPHMRNGLMLRHSFIWDGGIHYDKLPEAVKGKKNVKNLIESGPNKRLIFGDSARRRREHALYADGLYLVVGNDTSKLSQPVPIHEVTATLRSELYEDEIIAYRWTRNELNTATNEREKKHHWVFVDWYKQSGEKLPTKVLHDTKMEEVLTKHTAFDLHANRPDGAAFGSPDAIAAVVWARVIRDLIMNGVKMQDALAMFAFKASAPTKKGQELAALELAKKTEAGSAAAMGGDQDLVPLNTAGRGYDFASIGFIVSTMAASLHVSGISLSANTALAGSSYGAAKTLDLPGRMAMQTRRAEHIEFDERLLFWMGAPDTSAYFDNYDDSTDEYRAVQAAMLAWQTGTLSPQGFHAELEIIYGRKLSGSIPAGAINPNTVTKADKADEKSAADAAAAATAAQAAAPNQGRSSGAGSSDHASDIKAKDD